MPRNSLGGRKANLRQGEFSKFRPKAVKDIEDAHTAFKRSKEDAKRARERKQACEETLIHALRAAKVARYPIKGKFIRIDRKERIKEERVKKAKRARGQAAM